MMIRRAMCLALLLTLANSVNAAGAPGGSTGAPGPTRPAGIQPKGLAPREQMRMYILGETYCSTGPSTLRLETRDDRPDTFEIVLMHALGDGKRTTRLYRTWNFGCDIIDLPPVVRLLQPIDVLAGGSTTYGGTEPPWETAKNTAPEADSLEVAPPVTEAPEIVLTASPNPWTQDTQICFVLQQPENISLRVFDVTGRLVRSFMENEDSTAGTHTIPWNATAGRGHPLAAGVYFLWLKTPVGTKTHRVVLLP